MKLATPDAPSPARKVWRVQTLTYTTGGLVMLFCWLLLGDFAWSMRDRSVSPMAQWYLKNLGVSNLLFSLLITSFPAAVGLVLGPIISVKSDRHRGKRGRRIPFLLVTTPIGALGMIGIAFTPYISKYVHGHFPDQSEVLVAILCFGFFWAAFEFATIAGQAVFGGLVNDVVPKELLGRFYGLFRAVSLIDGIIFNYWIMGYVPTHFTLILGSIGLFYGIAFVWVCLRVREGSYPPPPPQEQQANPIHRAGSSIKAYFKECFSQPYYLSIFAMLTLGALCFSPVNAFSIPYARSLDMDMDAYGKCLAYAFSISLGLAFFLGWLVDLFHPMRMTIASLFCYLGVALWSYWNATTADSFAIAFVLHGVFSGCYFTSVASLSLRLYPRQKYAQFAAAGGSCISLFSMSLSPLIGFSIDRTGSQFHYTFLIGALLAAGALVASFATYRRFVHFGGLKNYVAP